MRRWLSDTLFKRLFVLMWLTLVVSHIVAYAAVMASLMSSGNLRPGWSPARLPTFPSLPPTPGVPDSRHAGASARQAAPAMPAPTATSAATSAATPAPAPAARLRHGGPPALPLDLLLLDYGVRLLIIAAAAWAGARWVSAPMRHLAAASRSLGAVLGRRGGDVPKLDEARGSVEVRDTARVFNEMAGELTEQFRSRGLLMAAISHDLRTPLTRMRIRLERLASDPTARRCIDDIREMDDLIESVFEVFREAGADEPAQCTDVFALVQSLVDDLVEQGRPVVLEGASVVARAQPAALRRVVSNLLDNALRYGERAQVRVTGHDALARIVIDDIGPGIPEGQLESALQPFYRVEPSRSRSTGGTGLGLYIARDLVARQGGRLSLSNRPGGGLRAEISLPR